MKTYILLILLMLSLSVSGQSFVMYSSDNELSSTLITRLYQDRNNMIWIATENGLNRFDGSKFVKYQHEPMDSITLCDDYVFALCEDFNGNLLIGTHRGVQIYDPSTDTFGPISRFDNGSLYQYNVRDMLPLSNGEILVSGDVFGSMRIKDGMPIIKKLDYLRGLPTDKLLEDKNGNIWISSEKNGLYRRTKDGKIKHYFSNESFTVIDMVIAEDGNIYVAGISKGLLRYDPSSDSFVSIPGYSTLPINNLTQGKNNQLLIATDGRGLRSFNYVTGQTEDIIYNVNSFDFTTAKIHSVIVDNADNVWLAIYQRGAMMVPKKIGHFRYAGRNSMDKGFVGTNSITSFCRLPSGYMLVGTDNDGIYSIAPDFSGSRHYAPSENPGSVPPIVMKLYLDSKLNIWIGAYNDNLAKFDYNTGHCTYIDGFVDGNGNSIQGVTDILEDGHGRLWISTLGGGIFYYDLNKSKLYRYNPSSGPKVNDWANTLALDADGQLLAGTYNGVYCINILSDNPQAGKLFPGYLVYDVSPSSDGCLWLGTSRGLIKWDKRNDKAFTFTTADGLPSNSVYALENDGNGNLWLSTNNGIAKMDVKSNVFTNYTKEEGLQGNEFSKNASFKDRNGLLWFGGINGITYFNPQIIRDNPKDWNIRLVDFYIKNGERITSATKSGGKSVVKGPVVMSETFHLSYEDNSFSMEFAPVEYDAPRKLIYQYSIDNNDWISLPQGLNRIYIDKLSCGKHEIQVRTSSDGILSGIKKYKIYVEYPWWRSWYAYFCYALVFILICSIIWKQKNLIRNKQEELRKQKTNEMINDEKLKFLINITHEIRTPMSLIIGPLKTIMNNDSDSGRQRIYQTILRNAERILNLVNQLMDLRKLEKGKLTLQFKEVDLVLYIDNIIKLFENQNIQRNVTLKFNHPSCDSLMVWISPDYFDKVIVNILSNAYKYTPLGGTISISLAICDKSGLDASHDKYAEIVIDDTGIGIPHEDLNNIFNRFYQSKNSYNSTGFGTGIGLELTRTIVNMHSGTINAGDSPEGGARFVILLPLGCEHIPNEYRIIEEHQCNIAESDTSGLQPTPGDVPLSRSRSKHRVLIVEDDREIRKYIATELSPFYHILECENGKEGLRLAFEQSPSLIISDVMMPEMDGMTMCREIKKNVNLNHIPVILLTARINESDNIEGLNVGADAYITKPFTIEFLHKNVDSLLLRYERLKNTFGNKQLPEDKLEEMSIDSPDEKLMNRIMKVVNENIDNPELTADMIADKVGISRTHLYRKLKELTNQSTRDFVRNIRLTQAANLMRHRRYSVKEIALNVGFSDPNNFSTAFHKFHGMYPTEYMNLHLEKSKED